MNKLGKKTRTGRWALTDTKTQGSTYSMKNMCTIGDRQCQLAGSILETEPEAL